MSPLEKLEASLASTQQTFDALETVLSDEATFQTMVAAIMLKMDENGDGELKSGEMASFLQSVCSDMGVDSPSGTAAERVFKHLDLNGDDTVSADELEAFLRHLLNEQLRQAAHQLQKLSQQKAALAPPPPAQSLLSRIKGLKGKQ